MLASFDSGGGAQRKRSMQTKRARQDLTDARSTDTQTFQRGQLFELLDDLTERIKVIESWLEKKLLLIERFNFC